MPTLVPSHATGDVYPAADWNTYARDDMNYLISQGTDLASAATITPTNYYHRVTGTTQINNITAPNASTNPMVLLYLVGSLTISHNNGGTGNIRLVGAVDATLSAGTFITFIWDATNAAWTECDRVGGGAGATVATTVAGLGAGSAGKIGLIRLMPATFNNGGATALPAATITVGDTTDFPTAGTITTANGTISYTGKTVTTFTGCTGGTGTLAANAVMVLASGTPPSGSYDTVTVVYDAVMGKWVSAGVDQMNCSLRGGSGTVNTWQTMVNANSALIYDPTFLPWRAADAAGLKPQVRLLGAQMTAATVSQPVDFRPGFLSAAKRAGNTRTDIGGDANAQTGSFTTGTTLPVSIEGSPWGSIPAYTLADLFNPGLQIRLASGTVENKTISGNLEVRWVG